MPQAPNWRENARRFITPSSRPAPKPREARRLAALIAAAPDKDVPIQETLNRTPEQLEDARVAARPGVGERKMYRKRSLHVDDLMLQVPAKPMTRRELDSWLDRLEDYDAEGKVHRRHGGYLGHVGVRIGRVILKFLYEFRGEAFPSLETIAERAGACISSVVTAIKRLVEAGFLVKFRRRKTIMVERRRLGRIETFMCDVQAANLYRAPNALPSLDDLLMKSVVPTLARAERRISGAIFQALNQTVKGSVETQPGSHKKRIYSG